MTSAASSSAFISSATTLCSLWLLLRIAQQTDAGGHFVDYWTGHAWQEYCSAQSDPLRGSAAALAEHLNAERGEDVLRIAAEAVGSRFEALAGAQLLCASPLLVSGVTPRALSLLRCRGRVLTRWPRLVALIQEDQAGFDLPSACHEDATGRLWRMRDWPGPFYTMQDRRYGVGAME